MKALRDNWAVFDHTASLKKHDVEKASSRADQATVELMTREAQIEEKKGSECAVQGSAVSAKSLKPAISNKLITELY